MHVDFGAPESVSVEAREYARRNLNQSPRDTGVVPAPDDASGWQARNREARSAEQLATEMLKARYQATLLVTVFDGVPALDIRPQGWLDDGKALVYVHGGAYVSGSAYSSLKSTLPLACEAMRRIVAVDYSLAPDARFPLPILEVVRVLSALRRAGQRFEDIVIYGDCAGATIAVAAALTLRDSGKGRLGGVILWSPWADITEEGDTYKTLRDAEPILSYSSFLRDAALAYVEPERFAHPHVSPVHADFGSGFPPCLIQVGTRDLFLSNAVRLYQALDAADQQVRLDVYEGMWHLFQSTPVDLPEARAARAKVSAFIQSLWSEQA